MRSDGPAQIEWRCPLCLHQGFLSGFDSTRWDLSSSGFAAAGRGEVEERVSFDEFSALLAAPRHRHLVGSLMACTCGWEAP